MSKFAVQVWGLGKEYHIGRVRERGLTAREAVTAAVKAPFLRAAKLMRGHATGAAQLDESIWALRDVDLSVEHGEAVGVIGRNGAGKSTLLKVLSRITEPTEGYAEIRGRVGSLLEVGTGFHPELTGRENVYLNGAILGMKRREIDRKFDEMVAFAEVERFIDTPVKHYSSGMRVRLAFAVAAHLEPEILIVDEVLSVGDLSFQRKCMKKMTEVTGKGRTVIFVSHNLASVQSLCSRGIVLSEGRVVCDAPADEAIRNYVASMGAALTVPLHERIDRGGNGAAFFTGSWLEDMEGQRIEQIMAGQSVRFCLSYKAKQPLIGATAAFTLWESSGDALIACDTRHSAWSGETPPDEGVFVCSVERFPLRPGQYASTVFLHSHGQVADVVDGAFKVDVIEGDFYGTGRLLAGGRFMVKQTWDVRDRRAVSSR